MINKRLVEERLVLIMDFLGKLRELAQVSLDEFVSNDLYAASAESYLRRALEACFDIGRHILAKTGSVDLAIEYESIARGLADKGIVSEQLDKVLARMAGYRNRMVHLYHQVTEQELHAILHDDLRDIEQFVLQIRDYLAGTDGSQ